MTAVREGCRRRVDQLASFDDAALWHDYSHLYDEILKRYPAMIDAFGTLRGLEISGGFVRAIYLVRVDFAPGRPTLTVVQGPSRSET